MGWSRFALAVAFIPSVVIAKDNPKSKEPPPAEKKSEARPKSSSPSLGDRKRSTGPTIVEDDEQESTRLPPRVIERIISEHKGEVKACYDQSSVRSKSPSGEITLHFVVARSGKPDKLRVDAPGVDAKLLTDCVGKTFPNWKFPTASTETEVDYPFVFVVGEK